MWVRWPRGRMGRRPADRTREEISRNRAEDTVRHIMAILARVRQFAEPAVAAIGLLNAQSRGVLRRSSRSGGRCVEVVKMQLKHLRTFVAAAGTLNLTRAGARLHLAQ